MKKPFLVYFQILIIALSVLFIMVNLVFGFFGVMAQITRQENEQIEPGTQYVDFKKELQGVPMAGFLTDGNETIEGNDGQFMLAQYILAPTVLDLDNPNHRYSIIDCSTPEKALGILKVINAKPVHVNAFGKILAERAL
jgi:hypothetical protein